jgi:glycosyltransferase involved in cell wall biosynthesis
MFAPTWYDQEIFYPAQFDKLASLRKMMRGAFGLSEDTVLFVTSARLDVGKNHGLLVKAMDQLAASHPNLHWIFAGEGSSRSGIERLIKSHGLKHRISMPGNLRPSDLGNLLRASDLFVLASHSEGMSISLLEAQACGCPVVASDTGEARRTVRVKENGMLLKSGSVAELASVLEDFLDGRLRLTGGAEHVQPFAAERAVPKMLGLLSSLRE